MWGERERERENRCETVSQIVHTEKARASNIISSSQGNYMYHAHTVQLQGIKVHVAC